MEEARARGGEEGEGLFEEVLWSISFSAHLTMVKERFFSGFMLLVFIYNISLFSQHPRRGGVAGGAGPGRRAAGRRGATPTKPKT